jgi:hypothetical protein
MNRLALVLTSSPDGGLRSELKRAFGIDLTMIPGIRTGIAQTLFGEVGPDFTKFRSASAFASWMANQVCSLSITPGFLGGPVWRPQATSLLC